MKIGAEVIREKYKGAVADKYDKRARHPKWQREQATVERWLTLIGSGASVLDIPVGTGRFLEMYARHGMTAIGMDVSEDMLAKAREKVPSADLRYGDILAIPLSDLCVDCVVAVRIMSWLRREEMLRALDECARLARTWIVTGGGRDAENNVQGSEAAGFELVDRVLIDMDARGAYELVLMRRS